MSRTQLALVAALLVAALLCTPAARAAPQDCIPTFTTASAACANVTAKPEPASACCNVWRTVAAECVDQGFTVIAAASGSGSTNGTAPLVTRAQFAGIYQACSLGALPAGDVVARWNSGPTAHCAVWDEDSDEWNDLKGSPWGGVGGVAAPAAPAADWVGIFCNDTLKNSTFYFTQAMQKGGDEALAAVAALELPDYTCGEDDDVEPIEDVGVAFVNSEAINSSTIMGVAATYVDALDQLGWGGCVSVAVLDPKGAVVANRTVHTALQFQPINLTKPEKEEEKKD